MNGLKTGMGEGNLKLLVVIVRYNVRHFLEQCLLSVQKSAECAQLSPNVDYAVAVVDNQSTDDTILQIRNRFDWVDLIENKVNVGFSKANNQAILKYKADFYLILNPDTLVPENCFVDILNFLADKPDVGALGVKMIDGQGGFLPESKRGLPTPRTAFFKFSGFGHLFAKSGYFNRYYMGQVDADEIADIDVLPGAFMWVSVKAIEKAGLLDEQFFMYGEDIDWSYRIQKAGQRVVYYPKITIVHYKGESTAKGSLNYVKLFYSAMEIFVEKHFVGKSKFAFVLLMRLAIWLQASMAITRNILKNIILPVLDLIVFGLVYWGMVDFAIFLKHNPQYYPQDLLQWGGIFLGSFWLCWYWITGNYFQPLKLQSYWKSVIYGFIAISVIYAFLPENIRFSRLILVFTSIMFPIMAFLGRYVLSASRFSWVRVAKVTGKRMIIVGNHNEVQRISNLFLHQSLQPRLLGFFSENEGARIYSYLGKPEQMSEKLRTGDIDEIIFCAEELSVAQIMEYMQKLSYLKAEYKIAPPDSSYIIGSHSVNSKGELYQFDTDSLSLPRNKRNKRVFEILFGIFASPLFLMAGMYHRSIIPVKNLTLLLAGKKRLIGYKSFLRINTRDEVTEIEGFLYPQDQFLLPPDDVSVIKTINLLYVKNYEVLTDFYIVVQALPLLLKRISLR